MVDESATPPAAPQVTTRIVPRSEVTPAFLEAAVRLLDRAFGGWPQIEAAVSAVDHLAWKANGPLADWPAFLVAEVDGQLAGCRTVLARNILVRGEPKLFLHFVDAGVDPAFQGLGANRATQEMMYGTFQSQFDLSIDDSNNPHMIRGRRRLGGGTEAFGNAVRPAVLPLDAMRLARGESGRLPFPLAALRLRATSIVTRLRARQHRGRSSGVAIRVVSEFDERFEAFCAAASAPFDFIPERTRAFLNWRYADPRAGAFTIRVAERDGQLIGYVVSKAGVDATHVVDLLAAPDASDVVAPLIDEVVDEARAGGAPSVSCWLPEHHPYRGALAAAGFFSLGETSVVYRPVSMPAGELAFLERSDAAMHFTYGDTDFI